MEKVQLNGEKTLFVPTTWADVTLETYEQYINTACETRAEQLARVGILCGLTLQETLQLPAGVYTALAEIMQFAYTDANMSPKNAVTLDGVSYFADIDDGGLSLAEYVDIKTAQKDGYNPLAEVLSIILRPAGEKYSPKTSEKRKLYFEKKPVSTFFGVLGFFLQCKTVLMLHTSKNLALAKNRPQKSIKNFAKTGTITS